MAKTVFCVECGHKNDAMTVACSSCGEPLPDLSALGHFKPAPIADKTEQPSPVAADADGPPLVNRLTDSATRLRRQTQDKVTEVANSETIENIKRGGTELANQLGENARKLSESEQVEQVKQKANELRKRLFGGNK